MKLREAVLLLFFNHTKENYKIKTYEQMKNILDRQITKSKEFLIENQDNIQSDLDNRAKETSLINKQRENPTNESTFSLKGIKKKNR